MSAKKETKNTVTSIIPLGANILVDMIEDKAHGIIQTASKKKNYLRSGYVVGIGKSVDLQACPVNIGDRVLVASAYVPIEAPSEEGKILKKELSEDHYYVLVQQHDIRAILKES